MAVAAPVAALNHRNNRGVTWNAIIEWPVEDVFAEIADAGLALHEAYTRHGASRVSCAFCIMSSLGDLRAAAGCADNHELYREMVAMEAGSAFAFQGQRWLADVSPDLLLPSSLKADVERAKAAALQRLAIEAEIPAHLLFTAGWPTVRPTTHEAALLASVRTRVAALIGIDVDCITADAVTQRYDALLALRAKTLPAGTPTIDQTTAAPGQSAFAF
ncbi:hypothetical protein [Paraburkholderia aromaticivorans]|uniref:hypothetical protein n=1 Tax=Paraburkholderia aromaticivorans TaxID=2026199 RepID=UPI001980A7A3|nr:hypothetical protein [Paraburkholderia aromaticivorans]